MTFTHIHNSLCFS